MEFGNETRLAKDGAVNLFTFDIWKSLHRCEKGQTMSLWLMATTLMSSVLMGTAYDMSAAWMHKQWADTAAQSACTAGAMDLLWAANQNTRSTPVPVYNFLPAGGATASGDCANSSSNSMCYYAKINGYASGGIAANSPSNDVQWSLTTAPPNNTNSPSLVTPNNVAPYMNVVVTENVPVTFLGIFAHFLGMPNSWSTIQVAGHCNCGLESTNSGANASSADPAGTIYAVSPNVVSSEERYATTQVFNGEDMSVPSGHLAVTVYAVSGAYTNGSNYLFPTVESMQTSSYSRIDYSCDSGSTWGYATPLNSSNTYGNYSAAYDPSSKTITVTPSNSDPVQFSCNVNNTNKIQIFGEEGEQLVWTCIAYGIPCNNWGGIGFNVSYALPTTAYHVASFKNN